MGDVDWFHGSSLVQPWLLQACKEWNNGQSMHYPLFLTSASQINKSKKKNKKETDLVTKSTKQHISWFNIPDFIQQTQELWGSDLINDVNTYVQAKNRLTECGFTCQS